MTGGNCREIRAALGVYVLGAIDPMERAQVDGHLATCPACREELAGLAGLPALLRRVPFAEAERLARSGPDALTADEDPSDTLLPSLLARTASVRRMRRWRALAVAAAVVAVAVGGGVTAGALGGQGAGQPVAGPTATQTPAGQVASWRTATGADHRTGVTLTVRYAPMVWGTRMDVQVSGVRPGTVCRFQVVDAAGRRVTVGGWKIAQGDWSAWYPASTSLAYERIHGFAVTAGHTVIATAAIG